MSSNASWVAKRSFITKIVSKLIFGHIISFKSTLSIANKISFCFEIWPFYGKFQNR